MIILYSEHSTLGKGNTILFSSFNCFLIVS